VLLAVLLSGQALPPRVSDEAGEGVAVLGIISGAMSLILIAVFEGLELLG
jgi:hypothetical protein